MQRHLAFLLILLSIYKANLDFEGKNSQEKISLKKFIDFKYKIDMEMKIKTSQ